MLRRIGTKSLARGSKSPKLCIWNSLVASLVGGPQGQVVPQELHDQGGILVRLLCHVVELGDGVLEGRSGHLAGLVGLGLHLVQEDRVVQGQTQSNRVGHNQVLLSNAGGLRIGGLSAVGSLGLDIASGEFRDVSVVIRLHLLVEDLGFTTSGLGDQVLVQETQDGVADVLQLLLDFGAVLPGKLGVVLVALALLLLLDAGDDPPGGTAAADRVLVGHGQQVTLLHGELVPRLADLLHVVCHLVVALGLLGELGEVDFLVTSGHVEEAERIWGGMWGVLD
mmetsp:Transcript_35137/g.52128  ORF Transcript_35137/g.52128 Transcript_35137/m.52128 type:complete len:280 (-) Transcript_35137:26-865(-)